MSIMNSKKLYLIFVDKAQDPCSNFQCKYNEQQHKELKKIKQMNELFETDIFKYH